jgi:hypothetical protein
MNIGPVFTGTEPISRPSRESWQATESILLQQARTAYGSRCPHPLVSDHGRLTLRILLGGAALRQGKTTGFASSRTISEQTERGG